MSDAKLRDLERRWKETGTVQDEAAYLLERVRVGDLTRERLELAAYCGHEAARTLAWPAATSPSAVLMVESEDLAASAFDWLCRLGPDYLCCALLALARQVVVNGELDREERIALNSPTREAGLLAWPDFRAENGYFVGLPEPEDNWLVAVAVLALFHPSLQDAQALACIALSLKRAGGPTLMKLIRSVIAEKALAKTVAART